MSAISLGRCPLFWFLPVQSPVFSVKRPSFLLFTSHCSPRQKIKSIGWSNSGILFVDYIDYIPMITYIYSMSQFFWWHPSFLNVNHFVLSRSWCFSVLNIQCFRWGKADFQHTGATSQVWIRLELFCGLSMLSLNLLTVFIVNKQECHGSILIPHFSCWNQWNLMFFLWIPWLKLVKSDTSRAFRASSGFIFPQPLGLAGLRTHLDASWPDRTLHVALPPWSCGCLQRWASDGGGSLGRGSVKFLEVRFLFRHYLSIKNPW
jgi:hypothetical protein